MPDNPEKKGLTSLKQVGYLYGRGDVFAISSIALELSFQTPPMILNQHRKMNSTVLKNFYMKIRHTIIRE